MVNLKNDKEIKMMAEGGKRLAFVRNNLINEVKEGVILKELDKLAGKLMVKAGIRPAFLGYCPPGSNRPYPASICVSINEVVVHGPPTNREILPNDVVKIDLGGIYNGFYSDTATTIIFQKSSAEIVNLVKATKEALYLGIEECVADNTLGDIGFAIEMRAKKSKVKPIKGLTGHGIGRNLHEEPSVFNEGTRGRGLRLKAGMVLAIEPMFSAGSSQIILNNEGGYATADDSPTAHFEHTVAITKKGPLILTK